MNNNYQYLLEYLPKRYTATVEQEQSRKLVYSFKDGYISDYLLNLFVGKIKRIVTDHNEWIICFIPASTNSKTKIRYKKLAEYIRNQTQCTVVEDAIYNLFDKEAGHLNGKLGNPIESFGYHSKAIIGKKVLLIDDVITRGTTFELIANKLKQLGASYVSGLFLAKTIHPDWHPNESFVDPEEWGETHYEPEETYEDYNGSYAQDIEELSDQFIDDVLDGEPEAYWNID